MQVKGKRKNQRGKLTSQASNLHGEVGASMNNNSASGKSLFSEQCSFASNSAMALKFKDRDDLLRIQQHQKKELGSNSNSSSTAKTSPSTDNSHDNLFPEEIYEITSQNMQAENDYAEGSLRMFKRPRQCGKNRAISDNPQSVNGQEGPIFRSSDYYSISANQGSMTDYIDNLQVNSNIQPTKLIKNSLNPSETKKTNRTQAAKASVSDVYGRAQTHGSISMGQPTYHIKSQGSTRQSKVSPKMSASQQSS